MTSDMRSLLASGFVCFFAGGLYGWSALIAPLQESFGVTTAQTGLVFSLAIVSFTIAVIAVPRCIAPEKKLSVLQWFAFAGAVCLIAAAQVHEFEYFLLWFSGGFGASSGAIYIAALGVAANTPTHKVATPAMVATFGVGGVIFGPVWRVLGANNWGLESLNVLAFGLFVSAVTAKLLPRETAKESKAARAPIKKLVQPTGTRLTLAIIWLTFAFGSFAGLMVLGLASKMMDFAQTSVGLASLGLAGIAIANTAGRLSVAWLSTHLRLEQCLFVSVGFTITGLTMAMLQYTALILCIGLILIAGGYGILASTVPVLTRSLFGADQFQRIFALVFTAWGVAGFVAPWAGGALFDISGSFLMPLAFSVLVTLFCGMMSWRLGKHARLVRDA